MSSHIPLGSLLVSLLFVVTLVTTVSAAQTPSAADVCLRHMTERLLEVRNDYRAHLFGARMNDNGGISVLTAGRMTAAVTLPVTGIFETRGRLTSELVDPLVESYRVLHCRSLEVCALVKMSVQQKGGDASIHILGCAPHTFPRIDECYLPEESGGASGNSSSSNSSSAAPGTLADVSALADLCGSITETTLAEERAALQLAVGYDSGYRSLLQIAGMMDWMLEGFSTEATRAVRDMVSMLGKLHQIPCFIGQCDSPKPPAVRP
ncbi:MAG: hypothetical protein PHZ00_05770 [Candidatus Peribacteraceae bacterium]|nr:hypothetical protein [Candidatus Peribacteraceae bacterium]